MVIGRTRSLLRSLPLLLLVVVTAALPWGQRAAHADTTTVCLRSQVPAGWVIISETFVDSCLNRSGYVVTAPATDGTTTVMCRGNLGSVPAGFVIVGESGQGPCGGFLAGTWTILKPPTNGITTTYCKGNLAGVPSGFVIVGEGGFSPCTSFSGTWDIRTPDPVGITTICRVGLAQIPPGYHTVGGTTSGGPCASFSGTWQIAPNQI